MTPLCCYQERIFSLEEVKELKDSITLLPRENFFFESSNRRWGLIKHQPLSHIYINPNNSWFPVSFKDNGEVREEKVTLPFSNYENYLLIKKTVCIALAWMAQMLSWQGQTKQMGMSILQHYHLQKNQTTVEIPWHRDNSDSTLVILLDDETQWSGGNFLFKVNQKKGKENVSDDDCQSFQPKQGYGLLFSNDGTQHCLQSLVGKIDEIDRTILTIHEKDSI